MAKWASIKRAHSAQQGFSLIEMMVAMVIGIIVLLALSELFVNNSRTRAEIDNTTQQIENGRYALKLLESELSNAGYLGEALSAPDPEPATPTAVTTCVTSQTDVINSMWFPVLGGDNVSSVADVPSCLTNFQVAATAPANDFLAIRRASSCAVGTAGCEPFEDGSYHLRVSACQDDSPGAIRIGTSLSSTPFNETWDRRCAASATPAPTYRYISRFYYIGEGDVLRRAELEGAAYSSVPLVEGIEKLQFEYGVDNDFDGEVDEFHSAAELNATPGQWKDVVAVRMTLLARNLEESHNYENGSEYTIGGTAYSPADGFKRQLYTSIVRLNNPAGRRED